MEDVKRIATAAELKAWLRQLEQQRAEEFTFLPTGELAARCPDGNVNALLLELQDLNILRSVSSNSYLLASKNFRDLLGSDEEIFEKLTKVGGAAV